MLADLIALLSKLLDKKHGYTDLDASEDGSARLTLDSSYELTREEAFMVGELMGEPVKDRLSVDATDEPDIRELRRALSALALQVPALVYDDFAPRVLALMAAYDRLAGNAGADAEDLLPVVYEIIVKHAPVQVFDVTRYGVAREIADAVARRLARGSEVEAQS